MNIHLPKELEPFEPDLKFFMDLMVRKLHINRHKGFAEDIPIAQLMRGLDGELEELGKALGSGSQFDTALEAVDIGNFAFLIAMKSWQMTKQDFKKEQKV